MNYKVPKASIKRLPLYRRCFFQMKSQGVERVLSQEIGTILKIDPATIRRDFSYLGELGRQGFGYEVNKVLSALDDFLGINDLTPTALVGLGNLGRAFLRYNISRQRGTNKKHSPLEIVQVLDVNDELINTEIYDVPISHVDDMEKIIKEKGIKIAILAVPSSVANEVAQRLERAGIEGIFNFSSTSLDVGGNIYVHDVDLLNEVQSFMYFVNNKY